MHYIFAPRCIKYLIYRMSIYSATSLLMFASTKVLWCIFHQLLSLGCNPTGANTMYNYKKYLLTTLFTVLASCSLMLQAACVDAVVLVHGNTATPASPPMAPRSRWCAPTAPTTWPRSAAMRWRATSSPSAWTTPSASLGRVDGRAELGVLALSSPRGS